jgi:Domain of unknown function (DUF4262)
MNGHAHSGPWPFRETQNTAVFICGEVASGAPILRAVHDAEGDWQFLCGGLHSEGAGDKPLLVCFACTVARDAALLELSDLQRNRAAERPEPGAAWNRVDLHEEFIRSAVQEHGWSVQLIPEGGDGEPAFAYSVGLHKTVGAGELIVLGLGLDSMGAMINRLGDKLRAGERPRPGEDIDEILEGFPVRLRRVATRQDERAHVGYALWFNGGADFPLWQVLWPDREGRFPGEPGCTVERWQPLLP